MGLGLDALTDDSREPVTTTSATVNVVRPLYGLEGFTVTATVAAATSGSPAPTGTVSFYLGSTLLGTGNLIGSTASLPLGPTSLAVGVQSIRAVYAGDANNQSSDGSAAVTVVAPSSIRGLVYQDQNNNGSVGPTEKGIGGVTIFLTGINDRGGAVNLSVQTDANGNYSFTNLRPSNAVGYSIRESQPAGYLDGVETLGTVGGIAVGYVSGNDQFGGVAMQSGGQSAVNYNFGERGAVVSFDVASGMTQRSWINALDVLFTSDQIAADLMANPSRVKLTKFGLNGPNADGSGGANVIFGGAGGLSRTGANLKLDFGSKVIGSGNNSTTADGYYRLELDFDGDGVTDAARYFYRLLGDVNGDRQVDAVDANLILVGMSRSYNRELDINGDGFVNGTDRIWAQRSNGRKIKDGLLVDD